MKNIKSFAVCLTLLLCACAGLSKNFVQSGQLKLSGGSYQASEWEQHLRFERKSWYQELILLFDLLYVSKERLGPFQAWLSTSEARQLADCQDSKIALIYASDSLKISEGDFFETMRAQGYERVLIPEFSKHLRLHPDYERLGLQLYKPYGLCQVRVRGLEEGRDGLYLNFPGFKEIYLNE